VDEVDSILIDEARTPLIISGASEESTDKYQRVNVIIPPLALRGPTVTIRKFTKEAFTIDDLIRFGTLTEGMARFIRASRQVVGLDSCP